MADSPDPWADRTRAALSRYAEPLRREVAGRLVRPRAAIPADELADRVRDTLANPPVVDRRIKELPDAARKLLAAIGRSRRSAWKAGHLAAVAAAVGHPDGLGPVFALLDAGLMFPDVPADGPAVDRFDAWAGSAGTLSAPVFVPPAVAARARAEPVGLPDLADPAADAAGPAARADGLDWPLRLAVAWQVVQAGPVRLTQTSALFKKDLARLTADPVLTAAAPDQLAAVPDPGVLAVYWAAAAGLLEARDGELVAAPFEARWAGSAAAVAADLWAALTAVEGWDPAAGYAPADDALAAFPTAGLLALLLLAEARPGGWVAPAAVAGWLWEHHPSWAGGLPPADAPTRGRRWAKALLLGVGYPLGLVEAAGPGHVRLTDVGRFALTGGPEPPAGPPKPPPLVVQPNAEVLAFRHGLTPGLIADLTRFAAWKGLGPACTLELTADQTYRGLESGLTPAGVVQALARHAAKPVPAAAHDLIRRWADKRERVSAFAAATVVEFASAADLEAAVARGVVAVKLTDRIGMTDDGRDPDFKHLRLVGSRDYEAKPQPCLAVAADGLTLAVDPAAADLGFEAEVGKLADPVGGDPPGVRRYRLTAASLRRAAAAGLSVADLDGWLTARSGGPLSPAARLLADGPGLPPATAGRLTVVRFPTPAAADGVCQWPDTAGLIAERLGPTAVAVAADDLPRLRDKLAAIGVRLTDAIAVESR